MQSKLVNLRLEEAEIAVLDKMAGKALNRQAVARMLLIAAIEAVERNGGCINLPPEFSVISKKQRISCGINEPIKTRR
jgi:hypothetical protein